MKNVSLLLLTLCISYGTADAQHVVWSPTSVSALTEEWTGERTADGRPKIYDGLLERLKTSLWKKSGDRSDARATKTSLKNLPANSRTAGISCTSNRLALTAQFMQLRLYFND